MGCFERYFRVRTFFSLINDVVKITRDKCVNKCDFMSGMCTFLIVVFLESYFPSNVF